MSLLTVVDILDSNIAFEIAKKRRMILMWFVGHTSSQYYANLPLIGCQTRRRPEHAFR
jgi:hypothetical protein